MSTAVRPRYKLTEVGVIPEDWEVRPVSAVGEVLTGKALAVNGPGKQRPYLRTKNVFDGRIDVDDVLTMPMTETDFRQFEVQRNDLLLNEGQSLELVGRCARYGGEYESPCAMQNQLIRFRVAAETSPLFAEQLFRHCQHTGVFARIALKTTSIAHLGGTRFGQLLLAWPRSLDEQHRVGAALCDADAAIDHYDRLLTKKRDLKQAAMQELLTGKRRLPGFHGEWKTERLGEIGSTYGGLTGKTKADFGGGAEQYVTFMNVMTNVVIDCDLLEAVRVCPGETQNRIKSGDLLFNGSSETPEEVAMCSLMAADIPNLFLNSFCFGFRLRDARATDGLFLAYFLRANSGRELMKSLAQGSTRYNLSKGALLDSYVRLPSKAEQTAIASVLSDMDAEIAALERRRNKAMLLKKAMMQELLTGRSRLV